MPLSAKDCRPAATNQFDSFKQQAYAGRMQTVASTSTTRRRALTLDDLLAVRTPCNQHRIALSPDGRYLAFAARLEAQNADPPSGRFPSGAGGEVAGAQLWVTDIERGESWPLLGDEGRSWRPSWSPDGAHLAFYADHRGTVAPCSYGAGSRRQARQKSCPTRHSSPLLRGWTRHAGVPTVPACTCSCVRSTGSRRQPAHRQHPAAPRTGQPWMCWCHRRHRPKTRRHERTNRHSVCATLGSLTFALALPSGCPRSSARWESTPLPMATGSPL